MNFRDVYGIISARGNAKIGKKPCTFVAKDCNFDKKLPFFFFAQKQRRYAVFGI